MPISSIDHKPPPFFRQGPSALTKLVLFSALAVFLMAADTRLRVGPLVRSAIATALLPAQKLLQVPQRMAEDGRGYLAGLQAARQEADAARAQVARQALLAAQLTQAQAENTRLRQLLELRAALQVRSLPAEVLYEAADPYSRKVFIDRGTHHGVKPGSPVVNEQGVLGQVTAAYPLTSVVTLLIDRDAAVPVMNQRTQFRSAAHGGTADGLGIELRFVQAGADVQVGDPVVTSGIDGVYPPGLLVGRVGRVDRRTDAGFARVLVTPAAQVDGVRHMLVLEPMSQQLPPRPDLPAAPPPAPHTGAATPAPVPPGPAAAPASAAAAAVAKASAAPPAGHAPGARP